MDDSLLPALVVAIVFMGGWIFQQHQANSRLRNHRDQLLADLERERERERRDLKAMEADRDYWREATGQWKEAARQVVLMAKVSQSIGTHAVDIAEKVAVHDAAS